jgi:hypothetical protein
MACCGKARAAAVIASGATRPAQPDPRRTRMSVVAFELIVRGPVAIVGAVSGRRYRFGRIGDRVQVDPRDRKALTARPELRWIR